MFPFQTQVDTEPVPPPREAPSVKAAFRATQEAMGQRDALLERWTEVCRVKEDHSAGEEAWHQADVAIEELTKSIPRARIRVRKADRELLEATRAATRAYTDVVQARWRTDFPAFVEQYVRPLFEAHQRLVAQHDRDSADGVSPAALPTLCYFLFLETATSQSGLCEWLRVAQREGVYPLDGWMPTD